MAGNISMNFLSCVLWILLCYLSDAHSQECQSRPLTEYQRLKHDLFCNYDKDVIPRKSENNITSVTFTFLVKEFHFNQYHDELTVHIFSTMAWVDNTLTWKHDSYGGVESMIIHTNSIWTPEIGILHSNGMREGDIGTSGALCNLWSDGMVYCIFSSSISIPCTPDITRFPYDSQNCSTNIKLWTSSDEGFELTVYSYYSDKHLLIPDMFVANKEWHLYRASVQRANNSKYSYMELSLEMKRHGDIFEATMIMPGLVATLATLLSFWLHSDVNGRLCLCSTAILVDCLYLHYLGYTLQENGASCPLIILFYRDHMLTSAAALLLGLIVHWMCRTQIQVPIMASLIFSSRSASWLLLAQPSEVGAEQKNQQWQPIAVILDRFSFLAFSITFIVLYFVCF